MASASGFGPIGVGSMSGAAWSAREVCRVLLIGRADPANNGEWFTDTDAEVWVPGVAAAADEELEESTRPTRPPQGRR